MKDTQQRKKITRRRDDHDRREVVAAEFVGGGPLDGMRLLLEIVREGPNEIRVLEMAYHREAEQSQQNASDEEQTPAY